MTTFEILLKCLPGFLFVGYGVNLLLTAGVPSWREKSWRHWKRYDDIGDDNSDSLPVALGLAKPRKPVAEGDFEEKTAVRVYSGLGILVSLIGFAWVAFILYMVRRG